MEVLLHIIGISGVGVVLDTAEEVEVVVTAMLKTCRTRGLARVHGDGGEVKEVRLEMIWSRDIKWRSSTNGAKSDYAQPCEPSRHWCCLGVGKFDLE